ncbi:uncharacterized protein cubi_03733 [Cryptosporidium ubiquitum]|uniref:Uncharacterized protein n=1 Tax=Cryptosporidium ubiquitum TaxID=857276 RepID=A0A1J4MM51_9CRYT|nr:uncharacterized protein cubi_03733 [Cryptosporidium ubiquitum]OII75254.1 hypothetical protein cubi_03733 [Cryptosporidium ubiquitum]
MSEQSNVQAVQPEQAQQIAAAQAQVQAGMNAGVTSAGVPYSSGMGQNMVFQSMAGGSGYFFPPNGSAPMSMGSGAFASVGMPGMYEVDPNMLSGGYSAPYGSAMGSSFYLPNQYGGSGIMAMPYTYDPYGLINPGIIPPVATKIAKKKRSGCC